MTLVLGGIRSGKSQYAEQIAAGFGKKILYVATAEVWPGAGSMEYRVRKHQERRPKSWLTLECPRHVASAVGESGLLDQVDGVILECVTLLASNTLYAQKDPTDYEPFQEALIEEIEALKKLIRQAPVPWVLVSSETGMGISQSDAETRHYCDGLGIANQLLAKSADEVYFMVAGLPLTVKKGLNARIAVLPLVRKRKRRRLSISSPLCHVGSAFIIHEKLFREVRGTGGE